MSDNQSKAADTAKQDKPEEAATTPAVPSPSPGASSEPAAPAQAEEGGRSWVFYTVLALGGMIGVFLVVLIIAIVIGVVSGRSDTAAAFVSIMRDLFIILLAMEGIIIGIALIVMILQLAALINILQNEIKPIIDSTQEAASTLRGTAEFLSKNVTTPVIKTSASLTGSRAFLKEVLGIRRAIRTAAQKGTDGAGDNSHGQSQPTPPE
jgi:hypothetical protein